MPLLDGPVDAQGLDVHAEGDLPQIRHETLHAVALVVEAVGATCLAVEGRRSYGLALSTKMWPENPLARSS